MAIFAAIAEAGSVTAAANSLGLPKSTVSLRLKELEERLDVVLIHRTTRRLTLTGQGQRFLQSCQELVQLGDEATRSITDAGQEPGGDLVISCPYAMSDTILPRVVAAFLAKYPKVNIRIIASNDRLDLMDHSVDLAFRFGVLADSVSMISRKIQDLDRILLASPDYLLRSGVLKRPADLSRHQCILSAHSSVWHFQEVKGQNPQSAGQFTPVRRITVNDLLLARSLAISGAGICMLPGMLAHDAVASGQLVPVLAAWPLEARSLNLVYLRHNQVKVTIRRFVDLFVDMNNGLVDRIPDGYGHDGHGLDDRGEGR